MKFSFPSLAQWRSGVLAALTRFPWNIFCGVTGAACAIISIHSGRNDWLVGQCTRLAMAAAVGMPLFFSLRMDFAAYGKPNNLVERTDLGGHNTMMM